MKELNTFMAKHAALYSDSIQSTQLPYISQNTCNASSHETRTNSQHVKSGAFFLHATLFV